MILNNEIKNKVLTAVAQKINDYRVDLIAANQIDLNLYVGTDLALYDRLKADDKKIDGMIAALQLVANKRDPVGLVIDTYDHPNGMKVINKTTPFGTIMIIYESRPDVTIEAAAIAFKSGNKIILKGGKESINSNLLLVKCWHEGLAENGLQSDWVEYLKLNRLETQAFLKEQHHRIDLIVPRGGEKLIAFVKENASCPVLVSGRGNNFLYVDEEADLPKTIAVILNAKTTKISACNALDKVLVNKALINKSDFIKELTTQLKASKVDILYGEGMNNTAALIPSESTWHQEFLDFKIVIGAVDNLANAIDRINKYSGGHSATIMTENISKAESFMQEVDCAAVYHNASTRFTDGGEFGLGAELAISTEKMHHRGPLGLEQLVTNKYYIYGDGQVRI